MGNIDHNSYILIHENAFENVIWKMAATLSRPQCVMHDMSHFLDPQNQSIAHPYQIPVRQMTHRGICKMILSFVYSHLISLKISQYTVKSLI